MPRREIEIHHRRIGEVIHLIQPGNARDGSTGTNVDKNLIPRQHRVPRADFPIRTELRLRFINRAVRRASQPLLNAGLGGPRYFVLACFHTLHIDADRPGDVHSEIARASRQICHAGAGHQCFSRDTARVHAGAAEAMPLDYRYPLPCFREFYRERRSRLAGPDDDRVVMFRHDGYLRWFRKSRATSATGLCSTSTSSFMRRIDSSEILPESSESVAFKRGNRCSVSLRTAMAHS